MERPQGLDSSRKRQRIAQDADGYINHPDPGHWMGKNSRGSLSSSSDRLTEEQENEIAENIYDWWISVKSYKQWYAEKFNQMKIDFGEEL